MIKKGNVPDAWDDEDWEVQADRVSKEEVKPPSPKPSLNKAARQAQHDAANRLLWESADAAQERLHFVEASNNIPLATNFKPQVKVLSRKPIIAKRNPASGMSQLSLDDDNDEGKKEIVLSPEEIRAKQKRDRDEKQRRYDEARAKIFGESAPSSRGSSPGVGTTTPPRIDGRSPQQGRGRGRGGQSHRAGAVAAAASAAASATTTPENRSSFDSRRPPTQSGPTRELFDPSYSSKPDNNQQFQRRGEEGYSFFRQTVQDEHAPVRSPRGPDGSGRGGFGFTRRGS